MTIHILVTTAEVSNQHPLYSIRRSEYMMCLHKILNYNCPTILINSETERVDKSCIDDILHKFTTVINIPNTNLLGAIGKSQQEYVSIKQFININPQIDDDDWVVKLSGRYLFIDDTFMNEVKMASPETQGLIQLCDNNTQMRTFCYALRYKWFKSFHKYPVQVMGYLNIERFILECILRENIFTNIKIIDRLGILANINNENKYQIF
jgi:hypothetical protein